MIPKFVYRGMKRSMYERNRGVLIPKNVAGPREIAFERSGTVPRTRGGDPRDMGAKRDFSLGNTILLHQLHQAGYPTSLVSTTPHRENAEKYALYEEDNGVIYVIDTGILAVFGVEAFIVNDFIPVPSVPGDEEIVLRARDGGPLPLEIVVNIVIVECGTPLPTAAPA